MKDKILKEVLEWYDTHEEKPDVFIEDFIDMVIDKTADALFEEVKDGLKDEFEKGNLKHPFIISPEYYLYLKLKEIKAKCIKTTKNNENNEIREEIEPKKE